MEQRTATIPIKEYDDLRLIKKANLKEDVIILRYNRWGREFSVITENEEFIELVTSKVEALEVEIKSRKNHIKELLEDFQKLERVLAEKERNSVTIKNTSLWKLIGIKLGICKNR